MDRYFFPLVTEVASLAGSFLRHLGFTSTAPLRVLGMISASDLTEFLKDWKIDGENATPAQRAGRYTANGR